MIERRIVLLIVLSAILAGLMSDRVFRFWVEQTTHNSVIEFDMKDVQQQQQQQQKKWEQSVVLLRNVTGVGAGSIVFQDVLPPRPDESTLCFFTFIPVNDVQATRMRMLFLADGSMMVLTDGIQLKIVWEPGLEVFLPLSIPIHNRWVHWSFRFNGPHRKLEIYLDGRFLEFIRDFKCPSNRKIVHVGCAPNFRGRENSNALFHRFEVFDNRLLHDEEIRQHAHRHMPQHSQCLSATFINRLPKHPPTSASESLRTKAMLLLATRKVKEGLMLLDEARDLHNAEAIEKLGELYLLGAVVDQNLDLARDYFEEAPSPFYLGFMATYGVGNHSSKDLVSALHCQALAAALWEEKDPPRPNLAYFALGQTFMYGLHGVRPNKHVAGHYLVEAARFAFRNWQKEGLKSLERVPLEKFQEALIDGQTADWEMDEMIEIERYKAEDLSNSFANEFLGDVFYHGKRTASVDYDLAQKYYFRANTTRAKVQLCRMHMMKQKLLPSNETFLQLLREASEHENSADATNLLGCVAGSDTEATHLFEKATRMDPPNLPVALTNSGIMHALSDKMERNFTKSRSFLLQAAAQGDIPAFYWLGRSFYYGEGGLRCLSSATRYLQQATRYFVLKEYEKRAFKCFLAEDWPCSLVSYLLSGHLGFSDSFFDWIWLVKHFKAELLDVELPASINYIADTAFAAHFWNSTVNRATVANVLATMHHTAGNMDRFFFFANYSAATFLDSEGLYNLGWYHEHVSRDFAKALRYYRAMLWKSHWGADVVGALSWVRAKGKQLTFAKDNPFPTDEDATK